MHKWFHENHMVLNPGKCLDDKTIQNGVDLKASNEEKLPGVLTGKNLRFDIQLKFMCRNASKKINALIRLSNYLHNA